MKPRFRRSGGKIGGGLLLSLICAVWVVIGDRVLANNMYSCEEFQRDMSARAQAVGRSSPGDRFQCRGICDTWVRKQSPDGGIGNSYLTHIYETCDNNCRNCYSDH